MSQCAEYQIRHLLNLVTLTERCLELPGTTAAERARWAAEVEQARKDLSLMAQVPELPDELVKAVSAVFGVPRRPASPAVHAAPVEPPPARAFRRDGGRHCLQR